MELLLLCRRHGHHHRRRGIVVWLLGFCGTLMMGLLYYWNQKNKMGDFDGIVVRIGGSGDITSLSTATAAAAAAAESESSVILSKTMTYMRYNNGVVVEELSLQRYDPGNNNNSSCSCSNPYTKFDCCQRYIHQAHKMGIAMTKQIFFSNNDNNENNTTTTDSDSDNHSGDDQQQYHHQDYGPIRRSNHGLNKRRHHLDITQISLLTNAAIDYRDVMVFRNVYSALISGYLYHKSGKECWLTSSGQPKLNTVREVKHHKKHWDEQILKFPNIIVDPPNNQRTICEYLSNETAIDGMRAYIGWVFAVKWHDLFERYAISQQQQITRERTMVVCYDDFIPTAPSNNNNSNNGGYYYNQQTIDNVYNFLYNGSSYYYGVDGIGNGNGNTNINATTGKQPQPPAATTTTTTTASTKIPIYHGPHSTSHDPVLRQQLKSIIMELDLNFFNGDIAWLDNILPC